MKISVLALLSCFRLAHVSAHGTEVAHCQLSDGTLRVFVQHWHSSLTSPNQGGTMTIQVGTGPSASTQTSLPTGFVNNVNGAANLQSGCVTTPVVAKTCNNMNYNDWGYWDFAGGGNNGLCTGSGNSTVSVTLLSGNTVVFTEACNSLYPAAIQGLNTQTFCNSVPAGSPTGAPSASPSAAPSPAPSGQPSPSPSSAPSFESVSHSVCENFAVHARTTITFDGEQSTVLGGDVSVSPGTSITGNPQFEDGQVVTDSADFAAVVMAAHAEAMQEESSEPIMDIEIGGKTFTPGTYRSDSAINFAYGTVVTLDGKDEVNPVFLFQAMSTLVTAADTYFILKNGAKAENVLWTLGTAATLGANSTVDGSIMAGTAITFGSKSVLHGCALAQSAVTFESEGSVEVTHYEDEDEDGSSDGADPTRHLRGLN
jgi:hypothetical protein